MLLWLVPKDSSKKYIYLVCYIEALIFHLVPRKTERVLTSLHLVTISYETTLLFDAVLILNS